MTELEKLREQIDVVDREIIKAFKKRLQIAKDVAKYKISNDSVSYTHLDVYKRQPVDVPSK